jgi:hypothetical protein
LVPRTQAAHYRLAMNIAMIRIRWAAIGAAVAVALGAGGMHIAGATLSSGERAAFVAIVPCRLLDTRADSNVGSRNTPLGPDTTVALTAPGEQGNCHSTVPATATALSLNVTAVGPSAPTFLTLYPTGAEQPDTSSLNPTPGEPPTPNAVTVDLNDGGQFNLFNKYGSVDVIVDVVGFYEAHDHDDRYYTKAQVDAAVAAAIATPNHITGAQVLDGSLGLSDLTGSGNFLSETISFSPAMFTVGANACITDTLTLDVGDAFRMVVPYRVGVGISGSASLSTYPVVLNVSGQATLLICNRSASPFSTTSTVTLDYRLT